MSYPVKLGDVCDLLYGDGLPENQRRSGDVPVYGSNGIVGWHDRAVTSGATIVVGRKGSIGEVHLSPVPCWPIDTTYYIEHTKRPCDLTWLYYMLLALDLTQLDSSSAVPGLNRNHAYERDIFYPAVPEQKRIAGMLAKADRLRRLRRYALEVSEGYVQAVFLEMFGDPVSNPKCWPPMKLGLLGELDRGRSKHRPRNAPHLYGGPYPFVQTGDIAGASSYLRSYKQTYSEAGLRQSKLWPRGALCITIAANIAKTAILTFDACFPDSIVGFTPGPKVTTEYIQWWFSFVQQRLEESAPESAQKNINLEILRRLEVPVPPIDLQGDYGAVIAKYERLRAQQREGLRQAEHLLETLLERAFRGEL